MDRRIEQIIRLIQEAPSDKLTLDEMARVVNLSPTHLRSLFKSEIEMTPSQYRKKFRLVEARRLLESTFLTVQEIMVRVGANDESHFTRDFKKTYGLAPTQYRMRHRQMAEEKESDSAKSSVRPINRRSGQ